MWCDLHAGGGWGSALHFRVGLQAKGALSIDVGFRWHIHGVYDSSWHLVSSCSVGAFQPTNLTSFEMSPAVAAPAVWLWGSECQVPPRLSRIPDKLNASRYGRGVIRVCG
jgi:hypothetical protein